MRRIAVTALSDGWKVTVDDIANDMVFRSGREAERAARKLAARLAGVGVQSEIRLHLRDGTLAAKFLCPATIERSVRGGVDRPTTRACALTAGEAAAS